MTEQKLNTSEMLTENMKAIATLYNSGILPKSEDEAILLTCFRQLNDTAKACELARLDGMLTMQMYTQIIN